MISAPSLKLHCSPTIPVPALQSLSHPAVISAPSFYFSASSTASDSVPASSHHFHMKLPMNQGWIFFSHPALSCFSPALELTFQLQPVTGGSSNFRQSLFKKPSHCVTRCRKVFPCFLKSSERGAWGSWIQPQPRTLPTIQVLQLCPTGFNDSESEIFFKNELFIMIND